MRKTKILATLGPASDSVETIEKLILAGMNGIRINFSHGDYKTHSILIEKVKKVREKLGVPIPLLLDTKGPEIRTKTLKEDKVLLEQGDKFTLTTKDVEGDSKRVSVTYQNFPKDLKKGDRVLLDDGLIELCVEKLTEHDIECVVKNGGYLGQRKGINVPGVYINLPYLTEKDVEDIKFGIEMGFDYVAASFVRNANDVYEIRKILEDNGGSAIEIIAKIENRDGVNNINDILTISNGIMVARGDLGVEIPPEEVPIVQKNLIAIANKKGKPVITATQMLESMISNPRPTRAEANDVANAVYDGSDTVMLSGETAAGQYPVEAVMMMSKIAETAEKAIDYEKIMFANKSGFHSTITNAISHSACSTAVELEASCIATVTKSGFTARMLSRFRPSSPILACTSDETVWRKLNLVWGCVPAFSKEDATDDGVTPLAIKQALKAKVAKNGDIIVICAGIPIGVSGSTNTLRVEIVGDILVKGKGIGKTAVSGQACVATAVEEIKRSFKKGDILVTPVTTNEIMPYLKKASALIVGAPGISDYTHAEITATALDIPCIICSDRVVDMIPNGCLVTVDPEGGLVHNGANQAKKTLKL